MIEIKGVSHSLGDKRILNDINLTLAEGSVMGLVGINGAGKTTLLRIISGVYKADEGEIKIDGESVKEESARGKLFFLPDDPYFTAHTTGNSLFEMYKVFYPGMEKAVFGRYMELFKLDAKKPIRNFSKGMRRQLFVALALAVKPKYLLLDEAFDGLDPLARLSFKNAINESVEENGMSVIISSHSLRELEDFCDSYALINKTTVSSSGDIAERVNQYCKFQLAFLEEFEESIFNGLPVIALEKSGRFVRIVLKGDAAKMQKALEALDPAIVEQMDMDFEEMFIREVEERGESR
ncbi:MAG: ABC transporter ATP-binding protein [Clostridia bacterium]|nr:ABC transporter ATP-binding protein [Clostridia bacterium]